MPKTILLLFCFSSAIILNAQPIKYFLNLDNITHHELRIQVTFSDLNRDTLEVRMPDASPGRYAPHSFAKNVYEVTATNTQGQELQIIRKDPYSWQVINNQQEVQLEYTLYANHGDGTYSGIDSRKLHLNMPATFIYGTELEDRPIELSIDLSEYPEWSVATQLEKKSKTEFAAPNYYYFYDSPTFVGDIAFRSWQVEGQTIEVAMMHQGTDQELDDYVSWIKKVVDAQKQVFGELPAFDFGKYTFLAAYNPWVYGDGMEHRNSTVCSSRSNLKTNAGGLIGTISHEFFHAWNVERIRPASLEPFDFDRANMSEALWFAEGITSYYDDLILCRTGIITPDKYITSLGGAINYVLNSPGRLMRNPMQMSHNAPFVDAATSNDETNYANNFVSYYTYGSVLGLVLDLSIRSNFKNLSLDDFMRNVWKKYGKTEIPYTMENLKQVLIETTGDEAFARRFFDESIYDSHLPDLEALLADFGITLVTANEGGVYFGRTSINKKGILLSDVRRGTAWYEAGVEKGDKIYSINDLPILSQNDFRKISEKLAVGQTYPISFQQLGINKIGSFSSIQDPTVETNVDNEASKKAIKRQKAWLWLED
jgi:predicted metalloprotease with PDZ domain